MRCKSTRGSGTAASLAGIEQGLRDGNDAETELGIRREVLLYSLAMSMGGIPLIYLGDELGTTNDYSYRDDPAKAGDSRWVHRPFASASRIARRDEPGAIENSVYSRMMRMVQVRKESPALAGGEMAIMETLNGHVFGYVRQHEGERIVILHAIIKKTDRTPARELAKARARQ